MIKRTSLLLVLLMLVALVVSACDVDGANSSDATQRKQEETLLEEGTRQVPMPNITHFRERRLLKLIYEMRDNDTLSTYAYVFNDMKGCAVFLGDAVGYGIPYSTEFSNPDKMDYSGATGIAALPQAEPNGLFSPGSAAGTWIMLKEPGGEKTSPVYVEPNVIVSPFKLADSTVCK